MRNHFRGREAATPGPPPAVATLKTHGFTMIELAVVIVIIGLLLAGGTAAWYSILEGRRVAKTAAVLAEIKSCLIQRSVLSGRYPTYTGYGTPADNTDNTDCDGVYGTDYDDTMDVDHCLCGKLDGWGQKVYFLEGIQSDGDGIARDSSPFAYLIEDSIKDTERTLPGSDSSIVDKEGNTIENIAFVLLSLGRNRVADHTSYDDFESGTQAGFIGDITSATVNFDPDDSDVSVEYVDDVILYVTVNELLAAVSQ